MLIHAGFRFIEAHRSGFRINDNANAPYVFRHLVREMENGVQQLHANSPRLN